MTDEKSDHISTKKTLTIIILILLAGALLSWLIFSTEPVPKQEAATRKTPMLVNTTPVKVGNFTPIIETMGTVVPSKEIQLQARVSGQVVSVAESFIPGMTISKNTLLINLDPTDYENQLRQSQSNLNQARSNLQIEMGEQIAAQQDYQSLDRELQEPQKSLILRKPQLLNAQAQMEAAQASLAQAKVNLSRTEITAPFNAKIQEIYTNLGSQVNVGDNLADLVGIDSYWVQANLPIAQLQWLDTNFNETTVPVTIHNESAWPDDATREGYLLSVVNQMNNEARMARLLLAVDDPLGQQDNQLPKLTLGAFVTAHIPAKELKDVARVSRQYLRKDDTLWLMKDGQLHIKNLNILFRDQNYIYVRDGLNQGDQIVTTDLSRVADGASLKLNEQQSDER